MIALAVRPLKRWLLQHRGSGHDLSGGTDAALVGIVLDEGGLHRVEIARLSQPFNGRNLIALVHGRKGEAGVDAAPVDVHGAGSALTVVAALFRAGQVEVFAQAVKQRDARLKLQGARRAVDLECDGAGPGGGRSLRRLCRGVGGKDG